MKCRYLRNLSRGASARQAIPSPQRRRGLPTEDQADSQAHRHDGRLWRLASWSRASASPSAPTRLTSAVLQGPAEWRRRAPRFLPSRLRCHRLLPFSTSIEAPVDRLLPRCPLPRLRHFAQPSRSIRVESLEACQVLREQLDGYGACYRRQLFVRRLWHMKPR